MPGPTGAWHPMEAPPGSPRANPGTDSQFPANCAGNLVSVPGLARKPALGTADIEQVPRVGAEPPRTSRATFIMRGSRDSGLTGPAAGAGGPAVDIRE